MKYRILYVLLWPNNLSLISPTAANFPSSLLELLRKSPCVLADAEEITQMKEKI